MFELVGMATAGAVSGVVGVVGHIKSRNFVRRRLRFTSIIEFRFVGLAAGVLATVVALPIVGLLPFVGIGTALAFGLGIGTGVGLGARHARENKVSD